MQALTCKAFHRVKTHKTCFFMVLVHRREHFNAAHRLFNPKWTKEKNEEIFGVCANEYYHGHNFELIVSVAGTPDADTGFVIDMKKLGLLVKEHVTSKCDHRNLNIEVEMFKDKIPSCEVMVMEFWHILAPKIPEIAMAKDARLHTIRLYETNNNFVEYFG